MPKQWKRRHKATILRTQQFPFLVATFSLLTEGQSSATCCNATMNNTLRPRNLGEVEQVVMDYVWNYGPCTAEACREALSSERPMKESTVRTILRRLEAKGYVAHTLEGRTFIYRAAEARENVAVRAVKHIIDRFCNGSAEQLLIGMVDHDMVDRKDLERLARKISQSVAARKSPAKSPVRPAGKDEKS